MALPRTTYDTQSCVAPSAALTDFSLLIDLSRMTSAWWSKVNTSDGTKGRAAKDADGTELATDWIDFDDSAETGWLRVKWSGTLGTKSDRTVRIYPPFSGNTPYAASDTYGSDNAYKSAFQIYYPDAGGTDRTSNGNDALSFIGGITAGGATGQTGAATDWDGSDDSIYIPHVLSGLTTATVMVWVNVDTDADGGILWDGNHGGSRPFGMWYDTNGASDRMGYMVTDSGGQYSGAKYSANASLSTGTWYHVAVRFDAGFSPNPQMASFVDGALSGTTSEVAGLTEISTTNVDLALGGKGDATRIMDGKMCEFMIADSVLSLAEINQEFDQGSSQSTFWGTWANTPPRRVFHVL